MLFTVVLVISATAVAAERLLVPLLSLVAVMWPQREATAVRIIEMVLKHRQAIRKPPNRLRR